MQLSTTSICFCTWQVNVGVVQPETFTRWVCEWNANTPAKLISSLSCTLFNKGAPEKEQSQTQKSYVLEQGVLQHLQASIHQTANYCAVAKQVQAIWNDASWMQKQTWCSGWLYYDWFDVTFSQTEKHFTMCKCYGCHLPTGSIPQVGMHDILTTHTWCATNKWKEPTNE